MSAGRYDEYVTRTTHAVLESPGETTPRIRWAVFHRRVDEIPSELRAYAEKVSRAAYSVTDADVDSLKRAGYTENAIFEITAAAALGAAIQRLERGMIVLHESRS